MIAACDNAGFPIKVCYGFVPTTDGKPPDDDGDNYLEITIGDLVIVQNTDARLEQLESADLTQMLKALDDAVIRLGQVTDTPMSRFQQTRQVRGEGTLKQEEAPLIAKVTNRQVRFGNSWEDVLAMARRLQNEFGNGDIDESVLIETQWKPAETRDQKAHIEMLGLAVEKLKMTVEMAWKKSGLVTPDEIEEMKASDEWQGRLEMQQYAMQGLGVAAQRGKEEEGDNDRQSAE